MSDHRDDYTIYPLDILLRVTDIRTEQALQKSLKVRAGLAAITEQRYEETTPTGLGFGGDDYGSGAAPAGPENAGSLQTKAATSTVTHRWIKDELRLTEAEIELLS